MLPCWLALDLREQLRVELVVGETLAAVAGGTAGETGAEHAQSRQADEAAVGTVEAEVVAVRAVLVLGRTEDGVRVGVVEVGGSQNGRNEERAILSRAVKAAASR